MVDSKKYLLIATGAIGLIACNINISKAMETNPQGGSSGACPTSSYYANVGQNARETFFNLISKFNLNSQEDIIRTSSGNIILTSSDMLICFANSLYSDDSLRRFFNLLGQYKTHRQDNDFIECVRLLNSIKDADVKNALRELLLRLDPLLYIQNYDHYPETFRSGEFSQTYEASKPMN